MTMPMLLLWGLFAGTPDFLSDPETIDSDFPPGVRELGFESHGSQLNATYYLANGKGPHPTVVLLHGFPGYEKNLDLAQAMRRVGLNVLFFHYRGSWGSEGTYSFPHVVEDVASTIGNLKDQASALRVKPDQIILVGHSVGGFAALAGAAADPDVACVAALAPANPGVWATQFADPESADRRAALEAYIDQAGPIRSAGGKHLIDEVIDQADELNTFAMAKALPHRPVLVVGAAQDTVLPSESYFEPLVSAYQPVLGNHLTAFEIEGDHAFSWTRIMLMEAVVGWLRRSCLPSKSH